MKWILFEITSRGFSLKEQSYEGSFIGQHNIVVTSYFFFYTFPEQFYVLIENVKKIESVRTGKACN